MPARRPTKKQPRDAAEAIRRLVTGNRVFAEMAEKAARGESHLMQVDPHELGFGLEPGRAPAQRPFAAVLGCSDARVPLEIVFQQRSNDVFVVRIAGNGIGLGGLGSFRYAAANFASSLRLVVVLGHSHCGAVTAAVEAFLRPHSYLKLADNMPLRTIVDSLLVSVRAASLALERAYGPSVARQPGYRTALVETSVVVNAAWAAYSLAHELGGSPLQVVYGRYDIANGRLGVPLRGRSAGEPLLPAPRHQADFQRLGERIARSEEIRARLGGR